ncbi:MAG: DUF402 domain-containing protein [Acidobacteriota bacterium]
MLEEKMITVNSRKIDGIIARHWDCRLLRVCGALIEAQGVFENEVDHAELGIIRRGTISHEYFWTDRWYNVFRFDEPDGTPRGFYCNICKPAEFDGRVLDYVDLDIDILVEPDLTYRIIDVEEYSVNANLMAYSDKLQTHVAAGLAACESHIKKGGFPFS